MATVLVIDEDAEVLSFVRRVLTSRGDEVVTVNRPAVAQKLSGQVFDAVVVEMIMEERDGVETILSLKRRWPACAVVAMSGGRARVSVQSVLMIAKAVGAHALLAKPFSATDLSLALDQAIGRLATPSPCR